MAVERASLVSSQAMPKEMSRDKNSGQGFQWLFKALGFLGHDSTFVNVCRFYALWPSEGQEDFWLRQLSSLLGYRGYSPVWCSKLRLMTDKQPLTLFHDGHNLALPIRTATAGSDVVQSGRPIFDDFSNICGRISAIIRRMLSSKWSSVCGLSHIDQ
ncbi:hypothetical protein TNCV_4659671 [Trichonephila clavipes]|uniref:Uncharacterized protein n=1 Tax=Trichonephila clavipes TaxID=2585209 RepID=A0A8X6S8F2_TRICX|nr:hypothetical protein TNCV_4659671 [Trichonephila clavipes]